MNVSLSRILLTSAVCIVVYGCGSDQEANQNLTAGESVEVNQQDDPTGIRHLMDPELNTASEVYWDNAGFVDTYEGTEDLTPETEEEWQAILNASVEIDRLSKQLQLPEFSQDRPAWNTFAGSLMAATAKGRAAVEAKDGDALFQAGADLYQGCVGCHQTFWSNNRFTLSD